MATEFRSTAITTNNTLPLLVRDPLLTDDVNGGVRFAFDIAFGWCYGGGSPVTNGATIRNLADRGSAFDGSMVVQTGNTVAKSGGGLDFSAVSTVGNYLRMPASVAADIRNNSQHFLVCGYFKMPDEAGWSGIGTVQHLLTWVNPSATADLVQLDFGQSGGVKRMAARRQTATGTTETIIWGTVNSSVVGALTQFSAWRNASGFQASIRTTAGRFTDGAKSGLATDNSVDFSGGIGKWGISHLWGAAEGGAFTAPKIPAKAFRVYRGFVEALAISGRDPVSVIEADWQRVVTRGAFT